jgi:amino acid permease
MAARGTFFSTTVTTLINIIGGGVLTLPIALHNCSVVAGCVLLTLISALSVFAAYTVAVGTAVTRRYSYHEVFARVLVGPRQQPGKPLAGGGGDEAAEQEPATDVGVQRLFAVFSDLMVSSACFALLVMYARVIGDSMPPVARALGGTGFWLHKETYYVGAGVIFFLLTCIRTLTELLAASIIGVATILNVAVAIVIRFQQRDGLASPEALAGIRYFEFDVQLFSAIPAFTMAAALYQTNVPIYYHELAGRTPQRMLGICATANGIALVVYVVVGVCGYLTFGSDVARADVGGNIVNNYGHSDGLINWARFGLVVHFLCVFPVLAINVRHGLHRIALHAMGRHDEARSGGAVFGASERAIAVEAFVITVAAVTLAALVPGVFFVVNLAGATSGMFCSFIGPGMMGVVLWSGVWAEPEDVEADDKELLQASGDAGEDAALSHVPHNHALVLLSVVAVTFGVVASVLALMFM